MIVLETTVDPSWCDYNGHLNDGWYAILFSRAVDALMDGIGLSAPERAATGMTIYTLETHVRFLAEVKDAASVRVAARVLEHDAKRLRLFLTLMSANGAAATSEQLLLSVDTRGERPRGAPWREETLAALVRLLGADSSPPPEAAGRGIALTRR